MGDHLPEMDTSVPRAILKKLPSQKKRAANPMLRATSPVSALYSGFSGRDRENIAKGFLAGSGYSIEPATPTSAYNTISHQGAGPRDGRGPLHRQIPAAGLLPSWRKHLPSTPDSHPALGLSSSRSASASAVLTGKRNSKWTHNNSPSGIAIEYKGPAFSSRQKIKALVKEARELSEHVSDTTMKQIEYFMTASPPPLSAAEATRRLGVDPPARSDSEALSGGYSASSASSLSPPPQAASTPAKSPHRKESLNTVLKQDLSDPQAAGRISSPDSATGRMRSTGHLGGQVGAGLTGPPEQQMSTIMVVRREKQAFGGGFVGRRRLDVPKWKEHGRLLAEAQKAMSSAMAAAQSGAGGEPVVGQQQQHPPPPPPPGA